MKMVVAFVVGICFGIAGLSIAKCNPTSPPDCGCKDCEKEQKCKPRCLCAQPLKT